jgi:hypothetical protein
MIDSTPNEEENIASSRGGRLRRHPMTCSIFLRQPGHACKPDTQVIVSDCLDYSNLNVDSRSSQNLFRIMRVTRGKHLIMSVPKLKDPTPCGAALSCLLEASGGVQPSLSPATSSGRGFSRPCDRNVVKWGRIPNFWTCGGPPVSTPQNISENWSSQNGRDANGRLSRAALSSMAPLIAPVALLVCHRLIDSWRIHLANHEWRKDAWAANQMWPHGCSLSQR